MPEKSVADSLRQVEDSRRLIQQSRTLMNWDALQVIQSKKTIAEAKWVLAKLKDTERDQIDCTRLTFVSVGGYLTAMRITAAMIEAARLAKFDHYQRGWLLGEARFIATPEGVILAMLEAAFAKIRTRLPQRPSRPRS